MISANLSCVMSSLMCQPAVLAHDGCMTGVHPSCEEIPIVSLIRCLRPDKIPQFALAGREGVRPAIAVVEHLCNDIAEGHVATLERKQSLIHLGINPDRSPLACTRHNNHSVVTVYKYIPKIIAGFSDNA